MSRRDDMRKKRNIVVKRRNVRIKIKRENRISQNFTPSS